MDKNIKKILDTIKLNDSYYKYFEDTSLEKLKVLTKEKKWEIYIKSINMFPLEVITELYERIDLLDKKVKEKTLIFNFTNKDINIYKEYFTLIINNIKKIRLKEFYLDKIFIDNDSLYLKATNSLEKDKLDKILDKVSLMYKNLGYNKDIEVRLIEDDKVKNKIKEELGPVIKKEKKKKEKVLGDVIIGKDFRDKPISLKSVIGEDNNVVVEGKIFSKEGFESNKTDFKIITLNISDGTDSIYTKIFERDKDKYNSILSSLKEGTWIKVRGYTKNDQYSKELVLNARDIVKIDNKDVKREDKSKEKRVELHAHTKMSTMDGTVDEVELIKRAISWGHKAIAITDKNGIQAFPHAFNFVNKHNKGKDEKDRFKVIYGLEIPMIDDRLNIVLRPNSKVMLEEEFVVFDFETTGFNAGGSDSIIEIGAVKIKAGEILDRYDELINPGRKLPEKIVELTGITDAMLKDKRDEKEAVIDFMKWVGDDPMVAHNARFDVSFLEMAFKKYDLGKFTNPVIDTLELSRTLDSSYSRHSLSALAKRYDIVKSDTNPDGFWDESSHHRGDYDAEGTALIFNKMLEKLSSRNIDKMTELDKLVTEEDIIKFGRTNHINILVKNKVGLKNLFKIVSLATTTYFYKGASIPRSVLEENREGLLIGSGCYESEVFKEAKSKSEDELSNIIRFYDYVEVQPLDCYNHLIEKGEFSTEVELAAHLEKIIRVTEDSGKIIVATGDVHNLDPEDKIYREIIVNQKVPGGGRHPLARAGITNIPNEYFRTTDEMLDNFKFLGKDKAKLLVIDNTNKIADMIEEVEVIIDTGGIPFSPRVKADNGEYLNCAKEVTELVFSKAAEWYGSPLPKNIEERISVELYGDIVLKIIKEEEPDTEKAYELLHNTLVDGFDKVKELIINYLQKKDESLKGKKLEKELNSNLGGIIGGGFDPIYLISQRLVKHSNDEGYIVGSRGSVGSSFVATLMGITEVNPLSPHYRCPKCKYSSFEDENGTSYGENYSSGFDLPDKTCPNCGEELIKDGQDMPFATFLGFNADKVPDIDLNFSDLNQASAHAYTKVLFGPDNVYRAGTVTTVAEKTAFGFVKGYLEEKGIDDMRTAEIERLAKGITGIKRTTGQHPGGIVVVPDYMEIFDFTPYQYPADDTSAAWRTTHFDYHSIDQCLLKLDILGHSDPTQLRLIHLQSGTDVSKVPLDDKDTMSIFTSTDVLGVTKEQIMCNTGTLGIPEFGTPFTIKLVEDTKPTTFGELVKISGLSHGTNVWVGNAQELIKNDIVPFKEVIGCRDDIMVYLMYHGLSPIKSFKIMEFVRKGRAALKKTEDDKKLWEEYKKTMEENHIPDWFIDSCSKIMYMFPKAHAAAYVISAFRIAWYKVHKPVYFYSSWFTTKATDVDVNAMIEGYSSIKKKLEDIITKGYEATNKEKDQEESLRVALEATARKIKFVPIDLYESEAGVWKVSSSKEIIPPFSSIEGLGDSVAKNIVSERKKSKFLSKEDLQIRCKISQTLMEKLDEMNILKDLPESNQLSLF